MPDQLRFVFLDRDGVINAKAPEGSYVKNWSEFHLLPGTAEAISKLNRLGIKVVVVTNQRGIARGHLSEFDLQDMHLQMGEELARSGAHVDAIFHCPHEENACNCRKPKPGLFLQAFERFPEATPAASVMVGDSLSDIQAARSLGIRTILIRSKGSPASAKALEAKKLTDHTADSLQSAVEYLLSGHFPES